MTGKFIPRKSFILLGHMLSLRDFSDTSVWNYTGTFSKSIKYWFSGSCLSFLGRNPEPASEHFQILLGIPRGHFSGLEYTLAVSSCSAVFKAAWKEPAMGS